MQSLTPIARSCRTAALTVLGLVALSAGAASPDLAVDSIDTSGVSCGSCPSEVTVVVKNTGSDFPGGSSVTVELSVTPAGQTYNRKKFRQTSAPPSAGSALRVTFSDILVSSCQQVASAFEAKAYLTGSDYREGNTRNNSKRVAETIQARCPAKR